MQADLKKYLKNQILLGGHQAQLAIDVLSKYSDDEERASNGRWTTGNSTNTDENGKWIPLNKQSKEIKLPLQNVVNHANQLGNQIYNKAVVSEPKITANVDKAIKENGATRERPGREVKSEDKIASKLYREKGEEANIDTVNKEAAGLGDAVRYTAVLPADDHFATGVSNIISDLNKQGYDVVDGKDKNYFNSDPENCYRGMNYVFQDQSNGQKFELQFHTPESLSTASAMHKVYEDTRELPKDDPMYSAGRNYMLKNFNDVVIPPGVENIGTLKVKKLFHAILVSEVKND